MRLTIVIVQVVTFLGLGAILISEGHTRLGISQLLLAGVNGVIYS